MLATLFKRTAKIMRIMYHHCLGRLFLRHITTLESFLNVSFPPHNNPSNYSFRKITVVPGKRHQSAKRGDLKAMHEFAL